MFQDSDHHFTQASAADLSSIRTNLLTITHEDGQPDLQLVMGALSRVRSAHPELGGVIDELELAVSGIAPGDRTGVHAALDRLSRVEAGLFEIRVQPDEAAQFVDTT